MKNSLLKYTGRSLLFYWKDYLNQIIIIAILAAIITGSLLTGDSVRESLIKSSREKLGNTYIVISSGLRFFDYSLSERLVSSHNIKTTPLLETEGYCQNFSTGATALNINIYGITPGFFPFNGIKGIEIPEGTIAVNRSLADHLDVKKGDEITIRFREADPIPENAPFAPEDQGENSKVFKISEILDAESAGNFSLEISQLIPQNIFVNLRDLQLEGNSSLRINRLLVAESENVSETTINNILKETLLITDLGLSIRKSEVTDETEVISDRIFIDSLIVSKILKEINQGYPVITYLANSLRAGNSETPYSFVSGIPFEGNEAPEDGEIIISGWLADDLNSKPGDKITLKWYHPVGNKLEERDTVFVIKGITGKRNIFSDPMLMPEFPGISGSTSCSSWDAGIPILMDKIRNKDEEYWNRFKGTPKAFVNYDAGMKLWGNNFGPATAVRFPSDINEELIINSLKGKIEPLEAGMSVTDVRNSGEEAARQGVDFGTLFLSLGFFIILSSVILLSFTVSIFFDSKKEHVRTWYSLGFRNRLIGRMLFTETTLISVTGAFAGVFLGYGVNLLIIKALNSVWRGAVQTNTISPDFAILPLVIGFISTLIIAQLLVMVRLRNYLKRLAESGEKGFKAHSSRLNSILLIITALAASVLTIISIISDNGSVPLSFSGGVMMFVALVFAIRNYYLTGKDGSVSASTGLYGISKRFYSFYPSQAVTPVIFIAAGIFAIIITSSNRLVLNDKMLMNEGGTGGYLLWSESAIPVKENLNTEAGRNEFGLNEPELKNIEIVQGLRLAGDDASCLNLNHIKAPPLLGINPEDFVRRGSFSFSTIIKSPEEKNPWLLLTEKAGENIVYGIADQTVLQWGMKVQTGDTLIFRSENGNLLRIVICGGLKSSIFQGHLLIGENIFREYFPSVRGSSVILFDENNADADDLISLLSDRFSNYGLSVDTASQKLASFFVVTNTYLNVFTILGMLGLVLGVFGLGFMLIRNYDQRRKEFALLMAAGYKSSRISAYIIFDQLIVLIWGIVTGTVSAIIATLPSLRNSDVMSFKLLLIMIIAILFTGLAILFLSVNKVKRTNLLDQLRKN